MLRTRPHSFAKQLTVVLLSAAILIGLGISMSRKKLTKATGFYTPETSERISGALEFGRCLTTAVSVEFSHRCGIWLVVRQLA